MKPHELLTEALAKEPADPIAATKHLLTYAERALTSGHEPAYRLVAERLVKDALRALERGSGPRLHCAGLGCLELRPLQALKPICGFLYCEKCAPEVEAQVDLEARWS